MKKASVITVCFNSELNIKDTIVSVKNQTYQALEHIIIDGNSTDQTSDIVHACSNNRIIFQSENDLGMYDAMNKGIKIAKGDVIFILNADDVFNDDNVVAGVMKVLIQMKHSIWSSQM